MKSLIFMALCVFFSSSAFAQDQDQYQGKCKIHSDYEGKYFTVQELKIKTVRPEEMNEAQVQALIQQVGMVPFKMVMNVFFAGIIPINEKSLVKDFIELVDDFTVEQISFTNTPGLNLIRFNVGYGGGNGGFATFLISGSGNYRLVSKEEDRDLLYCSQKFSK